MRRDELLDALINLLSEENQNFKDTLPKEIFNNIMSHKLRETISSLTLSEIEEYFAKHDIDINASNALGQGFLHYSFYHNEFNALVKYFVTKGININSQDLSGNTLLYYATLSNNLKYIKPLLDNGADANIENYQGRKPINILPISTEIKSLLESATQHFEQETIPLGQAASDGYLSEEV